MRVILRLVTSIPVVACLACLLPGISDANSYQIIFDENATWGDAQAAATTAGGYLVSITSAAEQEYVECLIARSNPPREGGFWLGLREASEGIYEWDNGEVLTYTNWFSTEPNNSGGIESRGQLLWSNTASRRGRWNDVTPEGYVNSGNPDVDRLGYVIEIGDPGEEPPLCDCTLTPNTYQVVHDADATWGEAQAAATAAGGYLVSITSAAEQDYVECLIGRSNPPRQGGFWTGLRETTEGTYVWDNGEALTYTHWFLLEPNNSGGIENRGQLLWSYTSSRRGFWNDVTPEGYTESGNADVDRLGYVIEIGCPGAPVPTCDSPSNTGPSGADESIRLGVLPNPFAGVSLVTFTTKVRQPVTVAIFDVQGRRVRTLFTGALDAGRHSFSWDGRDGAGAEVCRATYFVRVQLGDTTHSQKITLTR